ncbi:hypothetical protein EI94DRAFT_1152456 [Lactarius quietus]|nr:hypothetical protein EI94DRAFT_1152456 [Lactarius quietus]
MRICPGEDMDDPWDGISLGELFNRSHEAELEGVAKSVPQINLEIDKFKGSIASSRQSLEDVEAELEKLSKSLQEVKDYITDIRAKVKAAHAEVENWKDDLENLKTELDDKTEEIQAFCKKEVELTPKLNYLDKKAELKDNRSTTDRAQAECDKLHRGDVDDEEDEGGNGQDNPHSSAKHVKEENLPILL